MASQPRSVAWIAEQIGGAGTIRTRRMFGDDVLVGVICNDRLFLRLTPGGRALAADLPLEPAYEAAKPGLAVSEAGVEDAGGLVALVRATRDGLGAGR